MKKIYNSPEMDVIELKQQQTLLAGSVTFTVDDTNPIEISLFYRDFDLCRITYLQKGRP